MTTGKVNYKALQQNRPAYGTNSGNVAVKRNTISPTSPAATPFQQQQWPYMKAQFPVAQPNPGTAVFGGYTSPAYTQSRTMPGTTTSSSSSLSQSSSGGGESLSKTNLYIRGLTQNTTDKDLNNLCCQYGNIVSTKAILDKNTNQCKGYGFVDFESPVVAETAMKALQLQGVQAQMAKQQEQDPTNLYFANLPKTMNENELEQMLLPYGPVVSTRILRDNNGHSRGVGFARLESKDKCDSAIKVFNGNHISGCQEPLLVKFADGSKKRPPFEKPLNRWREGENLQSYQYGDHISQNGMGSQMLQTGIVPRYSLGGGTPVTTYQVQATPWIPPQQAYMMQSQVDPNAAGHLQSSIIPQLAAQMGQLQLGNTGSAYVQGGHAAYAHQVPYVPAVVPSMPMPAGTPDATNTGVDW